MNRFNMVEKSGKRNTTFLCAGLIGLLCTMTPTLASQIASGTTDPAIQDLRRIGTKVANAVLAKDTATLLSLDRADLRSIDETRLKDKKSDLFCRVFDSECLPKGRRSVFDVLSKSNRVGVGVLDLSGKSSDGYHYGLLIFYDRSRVSNKLLFSTGYLCRQAGRTLATWEFKLVDGRWEPANPLFDAETDSPC